MCSIAWVMVVSQGALSTTMWHRREICDRQESVPAFLFKTFLMEDTPDEHFLLEHIIPYYCGLSLTNHVGVLVLNGASTMSYAFDRMAVVLLSLLGEGASTR